MAINNKGMNTVFIPLLAYIYWGCVYYCIFLFKLKNTMTYHSQAAQDLFVLSCTQFKKNGTFLEIGSNDPIYINNTYVLEHDYDWKGIMVEYNKSYLASYQTHLPQSHYIMSDATSIDYKKEFEEFGMPPHVDYLQIDLEVSNNSTLQTLQAIETQLMDQYTFGVVTFEHDWYTGNHFDTRSASREIFKRNGYILVFPDVMHSGNPFEDWYVHPDCVDMNYIDAIKTDQSMEYTDIVKRLTL